MQHGDMVEVKEFFSNGYLLSLLLFMMLVLMNTLLQAGNFLMIREGVRLRGALQVPNFVLCYCFVGYALCWGALCAATDLYKVPDAVPPIHAVSSHVAMDKDPSKFRSIFSDNLQPIATRRKKARGTLLVDIGCSSKRAPLSVSYYNEISSGHIGSCC